MIFLTEAGAGSTSFLLLHKLGIIEALTDAGIREPVCVLAADGVYCLYLGVFIPICHYLMQLL